MTRPMFLLLFAALFIAGVISWFASSQPDGLERVAIDQGFEHTAEEPPMEVMPDYEVPGIGGPLSTTVAGILGVAVVFGLCMLLGRLRAVRHSGRKTHHAPPPY